MGAMGAITLTGASRLMGAIRIPAVNLNKLRVFTTPAPQHVDCPPGEKSISLKGNHNILWFKSCDILPAD
jgi:hypothetical protein